MHLRFSSSTGCCRFQLLHRDRHAQCKLCRKPRSTVQFLGRRRHARCVQRQVLGLGQCRKTVEVPQLQSVQFLERLLTRRLFATTGAFGSDSAENCLEVPQVQFLWLWTSLWACSDKSRRCREVFRPVHRQSRGLRRKGILGVFTPFFGLRPFGRRVSALRVMIFWEPSSTHTCECSRARGWRGRRVLYSQVFCHTFAN